MAKQLNVNLAFQADTSQAKQAIMDLQSSLSKVATMNTSAPGIDANKIKAASSAAKELSIHLNNAFNANTGKLDLSKLNQSLKTSGTNVTALSSKLIQAGAQGEQAFVKLAQSIAAADRPLITLGSKMSGFLTVLKNTARWQISSSILHGFIGSIQSAYGYAQDLNESLNNIRIVTGQTTDQMAKFAEQANKAAKSLSTTTTAYTDAALIFYQQGLKGSDVTDRADVVIKMANVSKQSAEIVSDQMTSIWNNFYDGSQSLESYADKITALGAATASSSEEIATGLEKFSAVAETVGLSYEYATAALATVTATTRQSADVVGTAFKTLFARLNDLKLGETLEDGTTLGQYTENLAKVGVDIKDASGQLKDMDVILEETAAKWQNLDKDQQVALAKGVAGIRQYTQFIALMDNWDFMEDNLQVVEQSGGTLQKQADTYAESWDAASKRVKASLETIYKQLLDDKFFIDINNGFASMLDSVSAFIDGIGGVKTILMYIGSLFLNSIANKITPALNNLTHTFSVMFQSAQTQARGLASEMNKSIENTLSSNIGKNFSQSSKTALENAMRTNEAKAKLQIIEKDLNAEEKRRYEQDLAILDIQQKETQEVADRITKLKQEKEAILAKSEATQLSANGQDTANKLKKDVTSNVDMYKQSYKNSIANEEDGTSVEYAREAYERAKDAAKQFQLTQDELIIATGKVDNAFRQMGASLDLSNPKQNVDVLTETIRSSFGTAIQDLNTRLQENATIINENGASFTSFQNQIDLLVGSMPKVIRESEDMQNALKTLYDAKDSKGLKAALDQISAALKKSKISAKDFEKVLKEINPERYQELKKNAEQTGKALDDLGNKQESLNKKLNSFNPKHVASGIETISKTAAGLGQLAMAAQSVRSIFQAWNNDDMSFGEKLTTTLISFSMIVPAVIGGMTSLKTAITSMASVQALLTASTVASTAATVAQSTGYSKAALSVIAHKMATEGLTGAELQEFIAKKLGCDMTKAKIIADQMEEGMKKKLTLSTIIQTAAERGNGIAKLAVAAGQGAANVMAAIGIGIKNAETGAVEANTAAWYANPIMWLALIIAGIVAALALLIAGIVALTKALIDSYNKDAIAAEKAKKNAEDLAKAHEEVKKELDALKSKFNVYDEAVEALEKCTKGTKEWDEALKKVNESALDLLNEFPELLKQKDLFTRDEKTGILTLDKDVRDSILKDKEQQVSVAQAASLFGSAYASESSYKARLTDLNRTMGSVEVGEDEGDADASAYDHIHIADFLSQHGDELIDLTEDEYKAKVAELAKKSYSGPIYDDQMEKIISKSLEFRDSIESLAEGADEVANQLKNTAQIIAEQNLSDEYDSAEKKMAGNELAKRQEEIYEDVLDEMTGDGISKASGHKNEIYQDIASRLEKVNGWRAATGNTVLGSDNNRQFVFLDEKGERQTKDAEWVAQQIAAAEALKELNGSAKDASKALSEMDHNIKNRTKGVATNEAQETILRSFITDGNFSNAKASNFDYFYKEVSQHDPDGESGGEVTKEDVAHYVDNMFGDGEDGVIDDETAKKYGYDSAQAMIDEFYKQLTNMSEEWEQIELPSNLIGVNDLSIETAKTLQSTINKMDLGPMGAQAGRDFTKGLNDMIGSLSKEEQGAALEKLGAIDWSSWDALEQADIIMKEFGVNIDTSSEKWTKFANNMRKANLSIPDYTKLKNTLADISKIVNSLDFGSIISDEDYEKLSAYNDEWERFFILQSDGSRKFIGDAESMKKATLENLAAQSKDLEYRKELVNNIKESKLDFEIDEYTIDKDVGGDGKDGTVSEDTVKAYNEKNGTDYTRDNIIGNVMANQTEDLFNNSNVKKILYDTGYTDKELERIITQARNGNTEKLQGILNYLQDYTNQDLEIAGTEIQEMYASTATTIAELDSLLEQGLLGEKTGTSAEETAYEKQVKNLTNSAIAAADSLDALNAAWQQGLETGVTLDFGPYIEKIQELASQYSICADNVTNYKIALQGLSGEYDGNIESLKKDLNWNREQVKMLDEQWPQYTQEEQDDYTEEIRGWITEDQMKEHGFEGQSIYDLDEEQQNKILDAEFGYHDWDGMVQQSYDKLNTKIAEQEKLLEAYTKAWSELEASMMIGEAAEKYGLNMEELNVQAQQLQAEFATLGEEYELTAKEAANLAIQNQRMNKGVSSMVDNWQDWRKELKKTDKTSQDWAKAAAACTKAIADLIGASEDLELPADFFDEGTGNMELLDKAAQGDTKAINLLGIAVAEAQVSMMSFVQGMKVFGEDGTLIDLNEEGFNSAVEQVKAGLTSLQDQINTLGLKPGTDVYSLLGGEDWVTSLNQLAAATQMTKEEMNNLLNEIGVQAEIQMETQKQTMEVPTYTEVVEEGNTVQIPIGTDEDGNTIYDKRTGTKRYTVPGEPQKVEGYVQVAQIKATDNDGISPPKVKFTGNGNISNSAKQGSSGGKSTKKAKDSHKKKSDAVDRYKEVNDNLEKTSRLMQKNSTLADGLWGKNRIDMLKENVKQMKEENNLLKEKIELANKYLTEDRADLEATGVGFTFDNDGYITNYTDIMNGLFAEYESKWNEFSGGNEEAELSEEQQEVLDKMWEHIETVKTAYEQYETTLDEVQDLQQEQLEKALQIQQENFAILQEELEIKLSINEDDLATIEYYLNKIADDFYSMFEAAALMVGDITKGATDFGEGSQGSIYQENLKYWEEQKEKLETSDITDKDYIEGLREVKAGIIENLQALQELDKAMSTYYVDTLRAGQEELAKYTSQMDRHNAVLEHYSNVLDIIGKSKDFESIGVVLEAQAHTAENAVKVAEENYNMLRKQADQRKAEYEAELAAKGEDDPGVQMLKKQWLDAEEVVGEAQDDMMQKTEEWAQALKAVVENELEGLAKELEKAFTANFGNSFEAMNTQMERAKSLQEEYLTTTNQVYETNKLIRQSQQEIDKTTNSVAKRRLKDFINETEQLQNKNKLSKFELEIQQAKYDLLLAEIALEEAQNAKSTVRLQRDSEGNFGYVYTADQNAIAEAEQKFADAQNSLYNIGLEGANDYTEKQAQALQEFYDTMTELQTQYLNGEIETEAEYQEKMAEAQKFYYEKLQSYSGLYGIAVAVDANIVRDAWSTEFQSMTQSSAQWQAAITTYLAGVEQAFGKWADYVKQIRDKTIGPSLDDLKGKTEGIKTANDEVTKQITEDGGLLDALESEYDKVAALTLGYAELKKGIEETIAASEKTIKDIDKDIKEKSGYGDGDSSSDSEGDSGTSGTDTGSDSGSGSGDSSGGEDGSKSSGVATWDRGYEAYKKINAGAWSNYPQRRTAGYNDGFTDAEIDLGQQIIDYTYPTSSGGYGYSMAKAKQLLGFDTGGYTGDWGGSYGKLAMLHKKELVLNAGDTDNFLAGMEMLDNIVKTIDLYSMNAQLGGILSSPSFGFNNRIEPIEQNVHIEAHFPEATDRNEITEAINTLVNQASQFVNRK